MAWYMIGFLKWITIIYAEVEPVTIIIYAEVESTD